MQCSVRKVIAEWKQHKNKNGVITIFLNPKGQIHVDNKLKAIQSQLDQGEVVNGGLLTHLLVSKELTLEEIYANMTEMLLAGVDTVSLLPFFLCMVVFVHQDHWQLSSGGLNCS